MRREEDRRRSLERDLAAARETIRSREAQLGEAARVASRMAEKIGTLERAAEAAEKARDRLTGTSPSPPGLLTGFIVSSLGSVGLAGRRSYFC